MHWLLFLQQTTYKKYNYKPKPVKSISHLHPSRQQLELTNAPKQAYIDDNIALHNQLIIKQILKKLNYE